LTIEIEWHRKVEQSVKKRRRREKQKKGKRDAKSGRENVRLGFFNNH
jgi:hypothetical protein